MTEGIVTPTLSKPAQTTHGHGGRSIGYAEFGDPNGKPVVVCHGFGDSRLTRLADDDLTARLGVRLITFDRPGIGLTDPMKALTILDRTDDLMDLVGSLNLQQFAVLGWSGGAPFALAAAGCIPERVTRVGIAGGFPPFERGGFKRLAPREIRRVMTILKVAPWMSNVMAAESEKQLKGGNGRAADSTLSSYSDSAMLGGSLGSSVQAGAEEAFRQGPAGVAADMLLLFRFKWGFNPEDVHKPVELWYGDDDHVTPVEVGRGMASILPDARLRVKPGGGHLLYLRFWEEILTTLIEEPTARVISTPIAPAAEAASPSGVQAVTGAPEPVDVLSRAPSWSWSQPETPAEEPAAVATEPAQEPAAFDTTFAPADAEPAAAEAPVQKPVWTAPPRPAVATGASELERLRALGFVVDEPETAAEAALAEPEAEAAVAEPEPVAAAVAEPEPVAEAAVAEPEADAEAAVAEPEAEAEAAVGVAEPVADAVVEAAEPEAIPEPEEVQVEAEAASVEPVDEAERMRAYGYGVLEEAPAAEPVAEEPEAIAEPVAAAEPEASAEPVAAPGVEAQPEPAPVEAAAPVETVPVEPEPAAAAAAPEPEFDEVERMRAYGYAVIEGEPVDEAVTELAEPEAPAAEAAPEPAPTPEPEPVAQHEGAPVDAMAEPAAAPEETDVPAAVEPEAASAAVAPVADEEERMAAFGFGVYEPEPEPVLEELTPLEVAAEPEPAAPSEPVAAADEAEIPVRELEVPSAPEPVASEPEPVAPATDQIDDRERLRAAGFVIDEPRPEAADAVQLEEPAAQPSPPAESPDDEAVERLRAAGFVISSR